MSGIVTLRHFGPVRYRPRPGRPLTCGLTHVDTPVRLTEITSHEMSPAGRLEARHSTRKHGGNGPLDLFGHGGHLWAEYPLYGAAGLVEAMMGRAAKGPSIIGTVFSRESELAERSPIHPVLYRFLPEIRVVPEGHLATMRVVHDGMPRARADLQSWLDANIRIVSGVAFVRWRGPLLAQSAPDDPHPLAHCPRAWVHCKATEVSSPFRAASHADHHRNLGNPLHGITDALFGATPAPDADAFDDILHLANAAPAQLLAKWVPVHGDGGLLELSERGMMGGIGPDGLHEALEAIVAYADSYRTYTDWQRAELDALSGYVRRVCIPAMSPPVDPGDAEAMEGLSGPGSKQ